MYGGDEVGAVVLDVGTTNTKAGFAGEDSPKAVFPTSVGLLYSVGQDSTVGQQQRAVGEEGDVDAPSQSVSGSNPAKRKIYYVGTSALSVVKSDLEVVNPVDAGLVRDWEGMEQLWDHAFHKRLYMDPKEHPILMGEASFNTRPLRERQTELMFEKYQIPALFVSKNAVLAAFASGKSSALVLDSGGGVTCSTPVHDGYALKKATVHSTLAGERLTQEYHRLLTEKRSITISPNYAVTKKEVPVGSGQFTVHARAGLAGVTESYKTFHIMNVVRDIKETMCRVSDSPFDEIANATIPTNQYELPDGKILDVGTDRFSIPELMFYPEPLRSTGPGNEQTDYVGVHQLVIDSIAQCDQDLRKELWQNIIVTGGNTLLTGFHERLNLALQDSSSVLTGLKMRSMATPHTAERRFAVWIGGSILASLGAFQQMWMSKAEYEEHGRALVERKCP
eukprot:TRINITY_DN1336_c0_g1_i3.p1 TRINITY_DN1336_c0_g1~~TRINITY_DN1336_c0_g1_i3.p1  ORF type:complete len:449 (-),score=108.03 TRINITY_DN1336_c0_g1_i3:18-1364(-)